MTQYQESAPVLTIKNLSINYLGERTVHAVKNVSLSLGRGEILGLAGESGCGKSTLAYGVNRLLKPPGVITSGTAEFHSREGDTIDLGTLAGEDLRAFRWDKISMVFQGAMNSLNPVISIRAQMEDIFTAHRPEMGRRERRERCGDLLERVGVDRLRLRSFPHELSGGMRQRVAILRAFLTNPQILLMDEPFGALDSQTRLVMQEELLRIWKDHLKTVVYVTHDIEEAILLGDRILVLSGRPGSLRADIPIPLPRPRQFTDLNRPEVVELYWRIWKMIEAEVRKDLGIQA